MYTRVEMFKGRIIEFGDIRHYQQVYLNTNTFENNITLYYQYQCISQVPTTTD